MERLLLCEQKQQTVRSSSAFRNKKRNHKKTRVINHIITVYFGKYLQIFELSYLLRWRQIFSGISLLNSYYRLNNSFGGSVVARDGKETKGFFDEFPDKMISNFDLLTFLFRMRFLYIFVCHKKTHLFMILYMIRPS